MAGSPEPHLADLEFRSEVIKQLLDSVECVGNLSVQFGKFLNSITAGANHRDLAYHLFCTTTLYISRRTILDREQESVLCRTIDQLRREWGGNEASSEHHNAQLCPETLGHGDINPKQSVSWSASISPLEALKDAAIPITGNAAGRDVNNMCDTFEHINIVRPASPNTSVCVAQEPIPTTTGSHNTSTSTNTDDLKSQYPFGHRLMTKQGWSDQVGLGPDGSGIQQPLHAFALTGGYRGRDTPVGLGYTPKTKNTASAHEFSTQMAEGRTKTSPDAVKSWHKYVADPHAGDYTAKPVYGHSDTRDTIPRTYVAHETVALANASIKTIDQDQYVIADNWNNTSTNIETPHANVSQKDFKRMPKTPPQKTRIFVPHSGSSEGW